MGCHICGSEISTAGLAARNLFWCPGCQLYHGRRLTGGTPPGTPAERPFRGPGSGGGPQNPCGSQGATSDPNATEAAASAPGRSSRTRPAAASAVRENPPR